jgi:hypothetical protein
MKHNVLRIVMMLLLTVATGFAQSTPAPTVSQSRRLIATVNKQIGARGPASVFKLYTLPALSNYHYLIEIHDETGKIVWQSGEIRNGVSLEGKPRAFQIVDVNADGYHDIKVLGGNKTGRAWYKVWLYDRKTRKHVWHDSTQ